MPVFLFARRHPLLRIYEARFSAGFSDSGHSHINIGYFVPGRVVGHAGLRQVEDALEYPDCLGGGGAVNAVGCDSGDGRVISGNAVQLIL